MVEQCLGKQLLRSGTSVGAHLSESRRSRSRAEIISKTEVALQELEESVYWMKLERISKILLESSGCELRPAASASIAIFSLERISKIGCAVKLLILDQLRLVKIVSPISIFYRFQKGACHGLERRAVATG
jgi:four helix bundle protein